MEATAIEEKLLGLPFLSAVEPADLRTLAQAAELLSFRLGEPIYHAGDPSRGFFIILSGRVRVFGQRDGKEHVVGTLEAGTHFGEEAVLLQHPYEYSTRAAQDTVVVRVSDQSIQQLLTQDPALRTYLQQYVNEVSIRSFLKLFTLLTPLSAHHIKALLSRLESRSYERGDYVFRQGEPGDSFYIVRAGRVEVLREGPERTVRWREIGPGGFFGEIALMSGESRGASIRCLEPTQVFRLGRGDFDELVAHEPAVKKSILEGAQHYQTEEALREQWAPGPPKPPESPLPTPPVAPSNGEIPAARVRWSGRWPFLRQHDASDCGAASLGMILRYYGASVSLSRLRDMANVSRDGASLMSLCRAAETLGFEARGLRLSLDEVGRLTCPAIVHWEGNHYVVLYQIKGRRVVLGDPAVGIRHVSTDEFEKKWTGHVLELHPLPRLANVPQEVSPLGRFLPLLRPHAGVLLEILLATLLLDILGLAGPVFTQTIVDKVLVQHRASLLPVIIVGMAIVLVSQTAVSAIRQYLLNHTSNRIDLSMLVMFYRHLLGLPVEYFQKRRIGDFISRFSEAARIRELITGTAITTVLDSMMVLVYLGLMLYYSVKLSLVVLAFVPIYVLVTAGFTPALKGANREILKRYEESQSSLVESISGVETVKTLAVERGVRWRWETLYIRAIKAAFRGRMMRMNLETLSGLLSRGVSLVLLCYGAVLVLRGDLSVGQLMAFNILLGSVLSPILRLTTLWDSLQETLVSVERLNEVMDSELEEPPGGVPRVALGRLEGAIK
ncbi:MAG TPA: peptidase domain-containing ABC transporter, partial [Candidatus Xenobia bacterium]